NSTTDRSASQQPQVPQNYNPSLADGSAAAALATPAAGPNSSNLFASNLGGGASGSFGSSLRGATTPEMMGDFFGPGGMPSIISSIDNYSYSIPIPSAGYSLGRMKQAENSSPIPRDRVFFNY